MKTPKNETPREAWPMTADDIARIRSCAEVIGTDEYDEYDGGDIIALCDLAAEALRLREYYAASEDERYARTVLSQWTDDPPETAEEGALISEVRKEHATAWGRLSRARLALSRAANTKGEA